ncbi:hypothetical protein EMPG_11986 [Blastomyces silverae]|uniref:Uncharacterized protein n=1 Tax=Blastomyces silverae TaxID=2060906 RepID=A0A0H1BNE5_9EURO|nr:hypothetical protein EMPG_11986 [Blastomyces silverae]
MLRTNLHPERKYQFFRSLCDLLLICVVPLLQVRLDIRDLLALSTRSCIDGRYGPVHQGIRALRAMGCGRAGESTASAIGLSQETVQCFQQEFSITARCAEFKLFKGLRAGAHDPSLAQSVPYREAIYNWQNFAEYILRYPTVPLKD